MPLALMRSQASGRIRRGSSTAGETLGWGDIHRRGMYSCSALHIPSNEGWCTVRKNVQSKLESKRPDLGAECNFATVRLCPFCHWGRAPFMRSGGGPRIHVHTIPEQTRMG